MIASDIICTMKKRLLTAVCFLFASQTFAAIPANVVSVTIGHGGLQTPTQDIPKPSASPFYQTSHEVGGLVYRFGLIHFLPRELMRLPFGLRIGVEGDYTKNADNTYNLTRTRTGDTINSYRYKSDALSILSVVQYQFDNDLLLVGKAGAARVVQTLDSKTSSSRPTATTTKNHITPELVAAAGYSFNKHIQALASYDYIMGKKPPLGSNKDIAPISFFGATLNILF